MNLLALVKGSERYVFLYDDATLADVLQVIGRFAADPELSFTWYDAVVLNHRIRREAAERAADDGARLDAT